MTNGIPLDSRSKSPRVCPRNPPPRTREIPESNFDIARNRIDQTKSRPVGRAVARWNLIGRQRRPMGKGGGGGDSLLFWFPLKILATWVTLMREKQEFGVCVCVWLFFFIFRFSFFVFPFRFGSDSSASCRSLSFGGPRALRNFFTRPLVSSIGPQQQQQQQK